MQQFEITLKNEKVKQYERLALFIIIINLSIFVYIAVSTLLRSELITCLVGILLVIAVLGIDYFLTRIKNNEGGLYKAVAIFLIASAWFSLGYWWVAVGCLLLSSLYAGAKRPLLVRIRKEKITYPSLPVKKINWQELTNIILKDGLLTLNFKNNRFIQQFVDETKTTVNEQEFNDFCSQQLKQ